MKPAAKFLLRAAERMANPDLSPTGCCHAIASTLGASATYNKAIYHFAAMFKRNGVAYWFGPPQYLIRGRLLAQSTRDTRVTALLLAAASYENAA